MKTKVKLKILYETKVPLISLVLHCRNLRGLRLSDTNRPVLLFLRNLSRTGSRVVRISTATQDSLMLTD